MASIRAQERRFAGIRAVTELALDSDNDYIVNPLITVDEIVACIEELRGLGKTDRWQNAITRWRGMVRECNDYHPHSEPWKRHLHWAILQGNVYMGHAAL